MFLSEPDWYLRARYPLRYEHIVVGHAENYRLDPALVAAVIYQESKFKPEARSEAGAVGLMQLLPETRRAADLLRPGAILPAHEHHRTAKTRGRRLDRGPRRRADPRLRVHLHRITEGEVVHGTVVRVDKDEVLQSTSVTSRKA